MGARLQGGVGEGMVGSHGLDTSTYKYVKNRIELVKVNKKDITLSIPVIVSCGGTPWEAPLQEHSTFYVIVQRF